MKYKPNSVRTYDADGFRRRAACVCVRDDSEFEVLLVSGSKDPGTWVVPGGGVEPTEDEGVAALREVQEEAGVKGKLRRQLGVFESEDGKTRTNVFVMVVTEMLDDWEDATAIGRRRKWFSLDEARCMLGLYKPQQQSYLQTLGSRHHTNGSSSSSSPATPASLLTASSMY